MGYDLFRSNRSYVFLVRSFGCALFYFTEEFKMKRTLKKSMSILLAFTLLFGSFAFGFSDVNFADFAVKARAEDETETFTEGYYTYTVDDEGNATITDVDTLISGDITVPSMFDDYIVTEIGSQSFMNCDKITSVIIPNGVLKIGHSAFFRCYTLTSIFVPESVEHIGSRAFKWCPNLIKIQVDSKNSKYSSDEYGVFFDKKKTTLIQCPSKISQIEYKIPNGVINIENEAFHNCDNLTNVVVPYGVTEIGSYVFSNCNNLVKIILPNTLSYIGIYNFYHTKTLTEVWFGGTEQEWNSIVISELGNEPLLEATIHFNYGSTDEPTTEPTTETTTQIIETTTQTAETTEPATEPSTTKPVATPAEPSTTKPAEIPTTTKPVETEPSTTKPATTKPEPTTVAVVEEEIIKKPSTTEVKYGETLILHADFESIPDGAKIKWSVEGEGVTIVPSEDGKTCAVTSTSTGDVTITAKYTDANGVEHVSEQEIESNASFWQKIVSFFKNLFGISRIIEQVIKF